MSHAKAKRLRKQLRAGLAGDDEAARQLVAEQPGMKLVREYRRVAKTTLLRYRRQHGWPEPENAKDG